MEHPLGHHEIGDHALAHRPHDVDRLRRPPHHLGRLPPHGQDLGAIAVERHQRGLVDDDPLTLDVNEHCGCPEVNPDLFP